MASRISELVNAALADEGENVHLATSEILDLIDVGRSQGGSEVHFNLQSGLISSLQQGRSELCDRKIRERAHAIESATFHS